MSLLQMRSTPSSSWLPSLARLLCWSIRDILPRFSRSSILCNNNLELPYCANKHSIPIKWKYRSLWKYSFIPTGSNVTVQRKNSRWWIHKTVVGHATKHHNVTACKTRSTITRIKRHVKTTPISAEDYLRNEMSKDNQPQTDIKFNKLVDHFA